MNTAKVEVEITITDQDIEDMPIGMGNAYWADTFVGTHENAPAFYVHERDDYGDTDERYFFTVTFDEIRKAFGRLFANRDSNGKPYNIANYILGYFRAAVTDGENGGIDVGHIDTDATDVLLQVAIWDGVIYG